MSVSHETKMRGTTVLCRCVDYKHATWSIWKVMSPQAQFDKIIFLPFFSKEVTIIYLYFFSLDIFVSIQH